MTMTDLVERDLVERDRVEHRRDDERAARCRSTIELFGDIAPDPQRMVGLAATAAAEIPLSVTRLQAAPALQALRAAVELSAAIGGTARRIAGATGLSDGTIAALAVELAEQVNLLALNTTIEATLIGGDESPMPPREQRARAERAVRELAVGVAAIRDRLDVVDAAVAALDESGYRFDKERAA